MLLLAAPRAFATDYYVDGSRGSNGNDGRSARAAFRTIQYAADQMVAGDVCLIAGGTYRESVSITTSNVSFRPLNDEPVVITATRLIDTWSLYRDNIYQTQLDSSYQEVTQLFFDQERVGLARFPNSTASSFMDLTAGTARDGVIRPDGSYTLEDEALAASGLNWTGARLWVLPGKQWVSFSQPVDSQSGNTLNYTTVRPLSPVNYAPGPGDRYFLYGVLDALDAPNEWFYDTNTRTLYFYAPDGVDPNNHRVEARTDFYAFVAEEGTSQVRVEGLHFYAANLKLAGSNSLIDECRIFYPAPWFEIGTGWNRGGTVGFTEQAPGLGVTLAGEGNTIKNSEVAYSWGDGVSLLGTNQTVDNCLIHDVDASATDCAGVATAGSGHRVTNNTIYNTGRAGVLHRLTSDLLIQFNEIYGFGRLTNDLGGTNCYATFNFDRDADTEISYNWIHDPASTFTTYQPDLRIGIYLDQASRGFLVHHNVVWNTQDVGIRTNLPTTNNRIYHNTLWNVEGAIKALGEPTGDEYQPVYNNLSNAAPWFGSDVRNNYLTSTGGFVDAPAGDFRLRADSPARNAYGVMRDLLNGSFENRLTNWTIPGAEEETVMSPVRSGQAALWVRERSAPWAGPRQLITALVRQHGAGTYSVEAWVRTVSGAATALLRVQSDNQPFTQNTASVNDSSWTQVVTSADLTPEGLGSVEVQLMTDPDEEPTDLYVDDVRVVVPANDTLVGDGALPLPGINDEVADGQPDAGAYEFGDTWTAGSSVSATDFTDWFTATPADPDEPVADGTIVVRAKGDCGSETMDLRVDGTLVATWNNVSTTYADYTYEGFGGGEVSVHFRGDTFNQDDPACPDRNLEVDYVEVCGTPYQTESVATKSATDCCPWDSDKLYNNGSFNYGPLSCTDSGAASARGLASPKTLRTYPNPVSDQLTVEGSQPYQVILYDLTGRPRMQHNHLRGKATLDVSHLRPGVYLLRLQEADGGSLQQRLVIE